MARDAYIIDRLVLSIDGTNREPGAQPGTDRLAFTLSVKNPIGPPGSTRRPPAMELEDDAGGVYPAVNADWAIPVLPDTEVQVPVEFEIPEDARRLRLVFAPGDPEEVRVDLKVEPG
jgi:hypothetical protein